MDTYQYTIITYMHIYNQNFIGISIVTNKCTQSFSRFSSHLLWNVHSISVS